MAGLYTVAGAFLRTLSFDGFVDDVCDLSVLDCG
jgi:hypothetical protein